MNYKSLFDILMLMAIKLCKKHNHCFLLVFMAVYAGVEEVGDEELDLCRQHPNLIQNQQPFFL